jgi:uncharacterized protein (TIGR02996 family)
MREALEAALVENPDDTAAHSAYADYLQEQGDPRGEFIQVQLELEDPGKSPAERKKLQEQEVKLLKAHQREWLGSLGDHLLAPRPKKPAWDMPTYQYQFRRGWLDSLQARMYQLDFTRALARAPESRLLRRLVLEETRYHEPGEYDPGDDPIPEDSSDPAPYALLRSPYLGNVRVLQYGEQEEEGPDELYFNCRVSGRPLAGLVKLMPRLEELYSLA